MTVDKLAEIIRKVDGNHKLGAGALAEAIMSELDKEITSSKQPAVQGEPVAWVTADTVDGQAVNGMPRRIWWENNEGVGMPIYAAPQPSFQLPDFATDPDDSDEGASLLDHGYKWGWNSCLEVVTEAMQSAEQQPLPCQECGGDGAGGEHEDDCAMAHPAEQQPAPDVAGLIGALEARRDDLRWMNLRHDYQNQTVEEADAALTAPAVQGDQQNSSAPPDIMAIRMLIAAGFVTEEKANEALCIAHGFAKGPIKPAEQPECGCCAQTTKCDDDCDARQPAPYVSALVEALEACRDELMWMIERHNQQDQGDGSWLYDYQTVVEADAALTAPAVQGDLMLNGFRVMHLVGRPGVREGERWEIYAPCGSGGVVHEDEVSDWVVRKLLDSLDTSKLEDQREPVGFIRHVQYHGIARNSEECEVVLYDNAKSLSEGTKLYTAPQPAEQRPVYPTCPTCYGRGWDMDCQNEFRPATCPDCAGSGKAEHSVTVQESDSAAPDVAGLVEALESIMGYIPLDVVHCRGDKCRELWCASCFGDEEAESYLVTAARHLKNAKSALAAHRKQGGEA